MQPDADAFSPDRRNDAVPRLPCFESSHIEAACRILGDTTHGLVGNDIERIPQELRIADPTPSMTKWKRLFNALAQAQNERQVGNHLIQFINKAMSPARYASKPEQFLWLQDGLNVHLAFAGYGINDKGQVIRTSQETSLDGGRARAKRLQTSLENRGTHPEIFRYCMAELPHDNYFHAVLEAVKGLAERLRQMSGLATDGAELVNVALSAKNPIIALNSLGSETEVSEQKGIAHLLIGVLGAIRNPTAHVPKVVWAMSQQDALDVFAILSYVHRKLDVATKVGN